MCKRLQRHTLNPKPCAILFLHFLPAHEAEACADVPRANDSQQQQHFGLRDGKRVDKP